MFPVQRYHHSLEKQQLTDDLRGQLTRANARLRSLQAQHERVQLREHERSAQVLTAARPSTCPTLPNAGGARGDGHVVQRVQTASGVSRSVREGAVNEDKGATIGGSAVAEKPCVRVVWGAGRGRD